jgi:hypothetical protein
MKTRTSWENVPRFKHTFTYMAFSSTLSQVWENAMKACNLKHSQMKNILEIVIS